MLNGASGVTNGYEFNFYHPNEELEVRKNGNPALNKH
jgi:hypothetical protein